MNSYTCIYLIIVKRGKDRTSSNCKPGTIVGQLNIAKTNKFDKITLALLKRLSLSSNIHTKLIYRGLCLLQVIIITCLDITRPESGSLENIISLLE